MKSRGAKSGIYPHLANSAAFFDRIVVAVWGVRRKRPLQRIKGESNIAIGGPLSFYARCLPRFHTVSGNSLQLKYGVRRRYANLSPYVVTVWAGASPVTCADLLLILDGLMRRGYKALISCAELTFDTQSIPLWRFGRELCSRASVTEVTGTNGMVTIYVGTPRSPWQMRIYGKGYSIVRVEFILRSAFLRAHRIHKPQDLLLLKKADLWNHVGFREVDHSEGGALPLRVRDRWLSCGLALPPAAPASIVERALRDAHINPSRWVIRSDRETLLHKMQKNLIW